MRLLGKIGGTADDVILPVLDLGNESGPFLINVDIDPVSDRDRIGCSNIFETEIPLDLTFNIAAVIGANGIPATGILNNQSSHAITIRSLFLFL